MPVPTLVSRFVTLLLATGLTACGGGGGGSYDEDDFFQILAFYDYTVTNPAGAPPPFTRTATNPGLPADVYSVDAGTGSIRGRFTTSNGNMSFNDTSTYTVNWSQGGPAPAQFFVAVTVNGSFPSGNFIPDSGALAVTWGLDTITVQYGSPLQIALNGGPPVLFTPFDFSILDANTAAPDWQRVASRASGALVDLMSEVRNNASFFRRVYDGDLDSGQAVTTCTLIPGTPPVGVVNQGEIVAQELNAQNYRITSDECFIQAPGAPTTGALRDGTVDLRNLVTTVQDGNLVSFSLLGSPGETGGVSFDVDLSIMLENPPGTWSFSGTQQSTTGGYNLAFQASTT